MLMRKKRKTVLSDDEYADFRYMYKSGRYSLKDIADHFDVSTYVVNKYIRIMYMRMRKKGDGQQQYGIQ